MNAVERHYRLLTIAERFQQLEGELTALVEITAPGPQQDRIVQSAWHAKRAAETVQFVPQTQAEMTAMLRLSIHNVRDQKRCADVGSEAHVQSTVHFTETTVDAKTANPLSTVPTVGVGRFPKQTT